MYLKGSPRLNLFHLRRVRVEQGKYLCPNLFNHFSSVGIINMDSLIFILYRYSTPYLRLRLSPDDVSVENFLIRPNPTEPAVTRHNDYFEWYRYATTHIKRPTDR